MEKDEKLTLKAAMNFLGVKSKLTMRKWSDSGQLPCIFHESPYGGWREYRKSDLVEFKRRLNTDQPRGLPFLVQPKASSKKRK